jgi:hypothetical protein
MPKVKMIRLILFVFVAASIAFSWSTGVWGHGEGTRIVPASLTVNDFTQVLAIPADAPPGSYRLTVEGGGKSAKVVISVN